ncbi:MAG TPA: S9 family peptidase [Gemmatimonadaceae bacterium]|nr:S9 family peptidase [Gemmatimonadaceae bacterium]
MPSLTTSVRAFVTFMAFVAGVAVPLAAQQGPADRALVTVERIYNTRDFQGRGFGPVRWLDDSTYTSVEAGPGGRGSELVRVDATTGRRAVIATVAMLTPPGDTASIDIEDYDWSADHARLLIFTNSARVWRANTRGDFWVLDLATKALRQLGGAAAKAKPSTLQFAKFSPDGRRVAYVREHNLYVEPVAGGPIVALTKDGSATTINGTFDWVYEEELYLRDGFRWSPDSKRLAYWQLDATGVRDFLLIDNTDSLYSFVKPVQYPKAGTTNSAARIGVVSADGGATRWMQVPGDPRNNYLARMDWAANSTELAIQQLNRRQTVNTLWFANAASGAARQVLVDRDSAWVDIYDDLVGYGTGPSLHWTPDGTKFVWVSERDGWRHAWMVDRAGRMSLITNGAYDMMQVVLIDMTGGWLYFDASPDNATRMFLWRTRLDGSGAPERLTPAAARGTHDYDVSPGGSWAIHTWSAWATPPVTELVRLPSHQVVRTLEANDALRQTIAGLKAGKTEFFQVDVGAPKPLDAWMMLPPDFDPSKKYPILFYVYGEPASQTVTDAYGGATWLWHLMLTQQGYIVASVDQEGTPGPKGRAWRKAVLNRIGQLRVDEQSAAAKLIARRPYVDSTRVGVWGWSGGGSSTLHLMFRAPDTYKVGMAVAPVADVHNYDTIYQERYVGLPQTDSAAYYDASPINFAQHLTGDLLLVHGSGDDNVHYQGTEQLINRLIRYNKPFQMMEYPNRTHGIFEGANTRTHLFNLLTRYLEEHLPAGPKATTVP